MELTFGSYGELMSFWCGNETPEPLDIMEIGDLIECVVLFKKVFWEFSYLYDVEQEDGYCMSLSTLDDGTPDDLLFIAHDVYNNRYLYSEKNKKYYKMLKDDRDGILEEMFNINSLSEFVHHLKLLCGAETYDISWDDEYLYLLNNYLEEYATSELSFTSDRIDDFPFYIKFAKQKKASDRVIDVIATCGLIGIESADSFEGRSVRYEIIAGNYKDSPFDDDFSWIQEIVDEVVIRRSSLRMGYVTKNITKLKEVNENFEAVILVNPDILDDFVMIDWGDIYSYWLLAVPLTKKEYDIYEKRGDDALYDYLNKRHVDVIEYSRLPYRAIYVVLFFIFLAVFTTKLMV